MRAAPSDTSDIPEAYVIKCDYYHATVECVYCGKPHTHTLNHAGQQRFMPHCSMFLSADDREKGYRFFTNSRKATK